MIHNFYSDLKWCIDNDYQVYIVPESTYFRIAIRKGGISSEGKDYYITNGVWINTPEVLGNERYKTIEKATEVLPRVFKYLRNKK